MEKPATIKPHAIEIQKKDGEEEGAWLRQNPPTE